MSQAVGRSRGRAARQPTSPFVILGVLAVLGGMAILAFAVWFYVHSCHQHAKNEKLARGITLLNELTPLAGDYFYSGKADKKEQLPAETWAPFKARSQEPDFYDAMIYLSVGREQKFLDAAIHRDAKDNGTPIRLTMENRFFFHPPGPPTTEFTSIQVVPGTISVNGEMRPAIFFRRPILPQDGRTDAEHGKAVIILLADAPVPKPARPKDAAPAGKKATPAPGPESPAPAKKQP